jgi:hypothetical protein
MTYLLDFKEQFAIAPLAIAAIAQGAYGLYRGLKADSALADLEKRRQARFMDAAAPIQENKQYGQLGYKFGLTPGSKALAENQFASQQRGLLSSPVGAQMRQNIGRVAGASTADFGLRMAGMNEQASQRGLNTIMGANQQLSGLQRADVSQDISDLQAQQKGYGLASQQGKMDVLGAIGGWAMGNLGKNISLFRGNGGAAAATSAAKAADLGGAPLGTITTDNASFAPGTNISTPTSPYSFGNTALSPEAMSTLDNATQNAYRKPLTTTDVGQITAPANLADKITIPTVSRENRVAPGAVGPDSADVAKVMGEVDMNQFNPPEQVAQVPPTQNYLGDLMGSEYTAKAGLGLPATALPPNPYQNLAAPSNMVAQGTDIAKMNPQEYQQPQQENYTSVFSVLENAGKSAISRGFMQPNQQQVQTPPSSTEDYRNMLMQESSMMGTPGYQFFNSRPSGQGPVQANMFAPQQPTLNMPYGQYPNMFASPQSMFSPVGPQSFMSAPQGYDPQGGMTPMNTVPYNRANTFLGSRTPGFMGQYQAVMTDQGIQYIRK